MKKQKQKKAGTPVAVALDPEANKPEYFEPKPNPMFPDWLTQMLWFVRYPQPVPCAHCGRRSRYHWTLCVPFQVMEERFLVLKESVVVLGRGAPVCRKHILNPAFRTPTADLSREERDVVDVMAALREPGREVALHGPGGYAFPLGEQWITAWSLDRDVDQCRTDIGRHGTAAQAIERISAKIPVKPSKAPVRKGKERKK